MPHRTCTHARARARARARANAHGAYMHARAHAHVRTRAHGRTQDVDPADVREFQKKLARKAVKEALTKCVKSAGEDWAKRKKCYTEDSNVKESYSTWMGKDSSNTKTDDIATIIRESEREISLQTVMS